tara:strand:+ start:431 stop:1081 length:651 start_codon:yes stop_codon:yes gene_type:complete
MSFKKNKYMVVKNVLDKKLCKFLFDYFVNKRFVTYTLMNEKYINQSENMHGYWDDPQAPGTYSIYSDIAFETLLQDLKPQIEKATKLKLVSTYSYARLYKKGDVLRRHVDRNECKVSATLNLGGDPWPIYVDSKGKGINTEIGYRPLGNKGIKFDLKPGDILLYSGCELEHWRNEFKGNDCAQVFLHYNEKKGKNTNKFDGRPMLGLPDYFRKNNV